jgi:quercetin dioxygenase-like cupin family protein
VHGLKNWSVSETVEESPMPAIARHGLIAHLIEPEHVQAIDVLGPTIQFLTPPEADGTPCVMRGTIPPGGSVPLHSHADPETFLAIAGEFEGLAYSGHEFKWIPIKPGDVFHVPGSAKHAFRNEGRAPAVMILISTSKIGRFFQEIGTPVVPGAPAPGAPSGEAIQRFLAISERYGYWNAPADENARIGIALPTGLTPPRS